MTSQSELQSELNCLIDKLNVIKQHPKISAFSTYHQGQYWITTTLHEWVNHNTDDDDLLNLIDQIDIDLSELLITEDGQHDNDNRNYLMSHGFIFEKGEEDKFGCLNAVIVIGDYRLRYG